ncbi:hypothetical protein NT05HA_1922 [Aggregatibacter aphrophilus NJ8700]|nr:hypothetical protein NT05HA_1922 [Aggregatibacter aphrophilus NJ8700]
MSDLCKLCQFLQFKDTTKDKVRWVSKMFSKLTALWVTLF